MAADFSLLLLEEDAGNGNAMIKRSGQTVKMRKYGTLTDYDLTEVGSSAKYKRTSLPTGLYQVVVNGSVDSSYGIIPWFDGELAGEAITSGTISTSRLPTGIDAANIADGSISNTEFQRLNGISSNIEDRFDGIDSTLSGKASLTGANNPNGQWEFSGHYPLVDNAIEAPTDPRHVTTKDYVDVLDDAVVHLAGSETISGAKQFTGNVVINTGSATLSQSSYAAPTDSKHYAPKKYVDDKIAAYLAGLETPLSQQSDRVLRVIYGGTLESNRVFLNIDSAVAHALTSSAAANKQYFILLEKNGAESGLSTSATISDITDYAHIIGLTKECVVYGADNAFTSGALGRVVIKDITLKWEAGLTATPSFTNVIFENVVFDFADNDLAFTTCQFLNCQVKRTSGNWTVTNCSGNTLLADSYPSITGYSPQIIVNGAYNQRRLGTLPTIASANTLTLTYGNTFKISGTTTIDNITTTGWTEGSVVTFYFENSLTVTEHNGGTGEIRLNGATNLSTTPSDIIQLMLVGNVWYQVSPTSATL